MQVKRTILLVLSGTIALLTGSVLLLYGLLLYSSLRVSKQWTEDDVRKAHDDMFPRS